MFISSVSRRSPLGSSSSTSGSRRLPLGSSYKKLPSGEAGCKGKDASKCNQNSPQNTSRNQQCPRDVCLCFSPEDQSFFFENDLLIHIRQDLTVKDWLTDCHRTRHIVDKVYWYFEQRYSEQRYLEQRCTYEKKIHGLFNDLKEGLKSEEDIKLTIEKEVQNVITYLWENKESVGKDKMLMDSYYTGFLVSTHCYCDSLDSYNLLFDVKQAFLVS